MNLYLILFTLLYFGGIFIFIYTRRGFDLSACVSFFFVLSSSCAIPLIYTDEGQYISDYFRMKLDIVPTTIYCLCNSLLILPLYNINTNKRRLFDLKINIKVFNFVVYLYFALFIVVILLFSTQIVSILLSSNLNEIRQDYYSGNKVSIVNSFPMILKLLAYSSLYLGACSYFMLIFFFYSKSFLRKTSLFNSMIFLSSLTPVFWGVLNVDRSAIFFWFIFYVMTFFLFKPYLRKSSRKSVTNVLILFGSLGFIYFGNLTIQRFTETDTGVSGGMLDYVGQPYLQFCYLWEKLHDVKPHYDLIFPIYHTFIDRSGEKAVEYTRDYYFQTGIKTYVFYSLPGFFMTNLGHLFSIIGSFVIFGIMEFVYKKFVRGIYFNLSKIIIVAVFAIIAMTSPITYFYTSAPRVLNLGIFLLIAYYLKSNINSVH